MNHDAQWILPSPPCAGGANKEGGLHRVAVDLLACRGITPDAAFFEPRLSDLGDPFALTGMEAVVKRLLRAIDAKERITLFGDYDVDGVSSVTLMADLLEAAGVKPEVFLPSRLGEGYGLSAVGLGHCIAQTDPQLLVAIDCGTSSHREVTMITKAGVDVVILDHHEAPEEGLPEEAIVLNPKASGEMPDLCSGGVVFKVAHAVIKTRPSLREHFDLREHLDLVALATVADLVPLKGENRTLVRHGLTALGKTKRPGLRALMDVVGVNPDSLRASDIGFRLGPRINAAGRIDSAHYAYEMVETRDPERGQELADQLNAWNRERQAVERQVVTEAVHQAEARNDDAILVLAGDDWHPGVVGIVAARIMRQFHRPAFVVGFDPQGIGKGSGRSVEGVSLVEIIDAGREMLETGGGHAAAAGISVRRDRVDAFRDAVLAWADENLDSSLLRPVVKPELQVFPEELDHDLLDAWTRLGPFGMGFPEPQLLVRGVEPLGRPRMLADKHYKFSIARSSGPLAAIWFGAAEQGPLPPPPWDIAFTLEANHWNGRCEPQIVVKALRHAEEET